MHLGKKHTAFLILWGCLFYGKSFAQNINGFVVKVKKNTVTLITFKEAPLPTILDKQYKTFLKTGSGSIKLRITPVQDFAEPIALQVEEGNRTHKLILKLVRDGEPYDDALDYSDLAKLKGDIRAFDASKPNNTVETVIAKPVEVIKAPPVAEKKPVVTNDNNDYSSLFAAGENYYANGQLDEAETKYNAVLKLRPGYDLASSRIEAIKYKRSEIAKKAKKDLEDKYMELFGLADGLEKAKKYEGAIEQYQEMAKLKPDDSFAQNQITNLRKKIEDEKKENQRIENDRKYQDIITVADNYFKDKEYEKARLKYKQSLSVKNDEAFVTRQIEKIDKAEEDEKRDALNRKNEEMYNRYMLEGDNNYKNSLFAEAQAAYEKAKSIKPYDRLAATKISDAITQIQNKQRDEDNTRKESLYQAKLSFAKKYEENKEYSNAITALTEAHDIKHEETFTKGEIARINNLVSGLVIKEKLDIEKQKTEEEYKDLIAQADKQFDAAAYENARVLYNKAKAKINGRGYPDEKITLINRAIQQQQEVARLQKEETQRQALEARMNERYNTAKNDGDKAFDKKDFTAAVKAYRLALDVKPSETYPKQKIAEIQQETDAVELARKAEKRRADSLRAIDVKYDAAVLTGNKLFTKGDFILARAFYVTAYELKPGDAVAQKNIQVIDAQLAEQARQLAIDNSYDSLLTVASMAMSSDFQVSLENFKKASQLKSFASYPKTQIRYLEDEILTGQKKKAEADSIRLKEERDAQYDILHDAALKFYAAKNWDSAFVKFQQLKALPPDNNPTHIRWQNKDADEYIEICANQLDKEGKKVPEKQPEIKIPGPKIEIARVEKKEAGTPVTIDQNKPLKQQESDKQTNAGIMAGNTIVDNDATKKITDPPLVASIPEKKETVQAAIPHDPPKIITEPLPVVGITSFETQTEPLPVNAQKKYPAIDFNKPPAQQGFNAAADVSIIRQKSKEFLLEKDNTGGLRFEVNKIILNCVGINFTATNAYFKFRVQNNSESDFLTGAMLLVWNKKSGMTGKLYPGHITSFPIVMPGKETTLIYVANNVTIDDTETLVFEMADRLGKTKISITVPGSVYNNEKSKALN